MIFVKSDKLKSYSNREEIEDKQVPFSFAIFTSNNYKLRFLKQVKMLFFYKLQAVLFKSSDIAYIRIELYIYITKSSYICRHDSLGYVHIKLLLHIDQQITKQTIHWLHHKSDSRLKKRFTKRGNEAYASLASDTAAGKGGSQSSTRVPPAPKAASELRGDITLITHP